MFATIESCTTTAKKRKAVAFAVSAAVTESASGQSAR
jgi:hypothetical protein